MKCCPFGLCIVTLTAALAATGFALGTLPSQAQKPDAAAAAKDWKGDIYTLDTCPVAGKKLGSMGDPIVKKVDDREVRFCCEGCVAKFESDKAKYWKQIDEQLTEQQIKHYPLTHCVVMEEDPLQKPGAEGEAGHEDGPVNLVYRNRLVRFCCTGCVKDFNDNPAEYIGKLDKAVIEQQKDKYPLETCPVSDQKLGSMGEPVNYVVGTMLVRFCCNSCVKEFEKNPQPVMAKVHEAWKAKHASEGGH